MPKRYSSKEILKVLKIVGFEIVRQKGSHIKLRNQKGRTTIVKANQKIIRQGPFLDILKQTNLSKAEFEKIRLSEQ